jgi:hypothetical protein
MKFRNLIQSSSGVHQFNLAANIIPEVGAGGVTFTNTIADFEYILVNRSQETNKEKDIHFTIDDTLFFLTLHMPFNEFKLEIDLFTGTIISMVLKKGYHGKLTSALGIGSKMSEVLKVDSDLYFDLDHSFYVRYPFDGLIIYPTSSELAEEIWSSTFYQTPVKDFEIDTIEILNMDYVREKGVYDGTLIP